MSKARDLANAGTALTTVSATELGYLDGVTSAVQTQIDSKIGSASAINPTIVDAKGDIIAATAADTVSRLAVGSNDTVLTADSSTATGLKWATPSSGAVVQIKNSITSSSISTTNSTYTATGHSVSITPTSASNKILIQVMANGYLQRNGTTQEQAYTIYRGATNLGGTNGFAYLKEASGSNNESSMPVVMMYLDSPATTSSTTYEVYMKKVGGNASCYYNVDGQASITVMEVTP